MAAPYPEKRLQQAALSWLNQQGRYQEAYSDVEATGTRIDSSGILDGKPAAIEVKVSVTAGIVRHRAGASGSLEAKIAATLRALNGEIPSWLEPFRTRWSPSSYPTLIILAQSYSADGFDELRALLDERSSQWQFGFEVWQWTGSEIAVRHSNLEAVGGRKRAFPTEVPLLGGSAKRAGPRTFEEFLAMAADAGLEPVLRAFIEGARVRRLQLSRARTGISISRPGLKSKCATLFVEGAGPQGFNVGIDAEGLQLSAHMLPGIEAPRMGFMNTNRYIASTDAVSDLLDAITDPYQAPAKD